MFTDKDLELFKQRNVTVEQIEEQLNSFKKGFPFLKLVSAATVGNGILKMTEDDEAHYVSVWNEYLSSDGNILKFVPASGAASRMFKNLFSFVDGADDVPIDKFMKEFFAGIHKFAFFDDLNKVVIANHGKSIDEMIADGKYKQVVECLLGAKGMNYGSLPKALLEFHKVGDEIHTALVEQLEEGAQYAQNKEGKVNVHFTVSGEHRALFKAEMDRVIPDLAKQYGVSYDVSMSEQKPSTDTIAVNMDNTPFRENGKLLFRPGGHGALIENLNDVDAQVVFVKNIDNVVPDRLKADTVSYKQVIAGILVTLQKKAFDYLETLEAGAYNHEKLEEIIRFVQHNLCCRKADIKELEDADLVIYLKKKLNRPMRVCGVVKNVGEPGGGPFLTYNQDGTVSLQILESSQIDKNNAEYMEMFTKGTHFNPVDLVCAVKDYKGNAFNLPDFVDRTTGFISSKSKNGKELKALELPGLWNGAMSDWNTVFVEVPLSTFNPVKTVNDLLRDQHQ